MLAWGAALALQSSAKAAPPGTQHSAESWTTHVERCDIFHTTLLPHAVQGPQSLRIPLSAPAPDLDLLSDMTYLPFELVQMFLVRLDLVPFWLRPQPKLGWAPKVPDPPAPHPLPQHIIYTDPPRSDRLIHLSAQLRSP